MAQDDKHEHYDDILNRIANRKPFNKNQVEKTAKSSYDLILDYMNAYDTLAMLPLYKYKHIICHGPLVFREPAWSGVVVWYHNKGYHGYKVLHLLGIWAHLVNTDMYLTLGIRNLPYRAAIYNPEGFHASIRKGFKLFYEDEGHPANETDTLLFQAVYDQKERLTLRQTLETTLNQWKISIETD